MNLVLEAFSEFFVNAGLLAIFISAVSAGIGLLVKAVSGKFGGVV